MGIIQAHCCDKRERDRVHERDLSSEEDPNSMFSAFVTSPQYRRMGLPFFFSSILWLLLVKVAVWQCPRAGGWAPSERCKSRYGDEATALLWNRVNNGLRFFSSGIGQKELFESNQGYLIQCV